MIGVSSTSRTRKLSPDDAAVARAAFTLLEVLLALSLSVVLLVAVYGAFDLYIRFTNAGHDDMEQAQIARALLRRMSSDIRSTVYRAPTQGSSLGSSSSDQSDSSGNSSDQSGSSGSSGSNNNGSSGSQSGNSGAGGSNSSGGSGSSQSGGSGSSSGSSGSNSSGSNSSSNSSSGSANEDTAVDPTSAFSQAMTGLVGDSTTLVLHVARVTRQVIPQVEPTDGAPANNGEEKSISYFLADAAADGLAGAVGDAYKKANRTTGDIQGLARLEGNRLAIQIADEQSNMDRLAESAKLIAPEVTSMVFRYFDGVDWLDSWDSGLSQKLPNAVEISLKVRRMGRKDVKAAKEATRRDGEQPGEVYRLTVAIPTAEPYIPPAQ